MGYYIVVFFNKKYDIFFVKKLLIKYKIYCIIISRKEQNMQKEKPVKPRGVKKGETPQWNVGRKKIESKIKYTSKSISLPTEKWDELEIKAQEQGMTKNKLVADLIEKYLKKNRRKNEKNKTKK